MTKARRDFRPGSSYASRALVFNNVISVINVLKNITLFVQDKMKLFDSIVLPILIYGNEIWGFCKSDDTEKVHIRFLK